MQSLSRRKLLYLVILVHFFSGGGVTFKDINHILIRAYAKLYSTNYGHITIPNLRVGNETNVYWE